MTLLLFLSASQTKQFMHGYQTTQHDTFVCSILPLPHCIKRRKHSKIHTPYHTHPSEAPENGIPKTEIQSPTKKVPRLPRTPPTWNLFESQRPHNPPALSTFEKKKIPSERAHTEAYHVFPPKASNYPATDTHIHANKIDMTVFISIIVTSSRGCGVCVWR